MTQRSFLFSNTTNFVYDIIGLSLIARSTYCMFAGLTDKKWQELVMTFTHWGMFMLGFYFLFSVLFTLTRIPALNKLRLAMLQLASSSQLAIFIFYWVFLARINIPMMLALEPKSKAKFEFSSTVMKHLIYPLMAWFPVMTENTKFELKSLKKVHLLFVFYLLTNFMGVQYLGRPIYPMVDYKGFGTVVFLVICYTLLRVGFWLSYKISSSIKQKFDFIQKQEKMKKTK